MVQSTSLSVSGWNPLHPKSVRSIAELTVFSIVNSMSSPTEWKRQSRNIYTPAHRLACLTFFFFSRGNDSMAKAKYKKKSLLFTVLKVGQNVQLSEGTESGNGPQTSELECPKTWITWILNFFSLSHNSTYSQNSYAFTLNVQAFTAKTKMRATQHFLIMNM